MNLTPTEQWTQAIAEAIENNDLKSAILLATKEREEAEQYYSCKRECNGIIIEVDFR